MLETTYDNEEGKSFILFRNKVRLLDLLSASTLRLLLLLKFNGRLSVIVQNGRVLKSGYEESYFRRVEPTIGASS